ncbi:MAG: family 20 glycosylhydrolase [Oligosphaeraceae bacterium]|nr:family 20 glycosylhydrolase [Oligosphaeraceae bacterium]
MCVSKHNRTVLVLCGMVLPALLAGAEIDLFLPGTTSFSCYTTSWKAGSDMNAGSEVVQRDGQNYLKLTYRGTQGTARANLKIERPLPENKTRRLFYRIAYDGSDQPRFQISVIFHHDPRAILVGSILLQQGEHDYRFEPSYRRAEASLNLHQAANVILDSGPENAGRSIFLKRVFLQEEELQLQQSREMPILQRRRSAEVLPDFQPLFTGRSLQVQAKYDEQALYLHTTASFAGRPPVALVKPGDNRNRLWQDELLELFCSGELDNQSYFQYVFNAAGAEWGSSTHYDVTAAAVTRHSDFIPEHTRVMRLEDNVWQTELTIPFISLRKTEREFINFQIVQNISAAKADVWNPSDKYPPPRNYGLLYFNARPFGGGTSEILSVRCLEYAGMDKAGIAIALKNSGQEPGCQARVHLVAPDYSILSSELLPLAESLTLNGCKNLPGLYSIYLEVLNQAGSRFVTGINCRNDREFPDRSRETVLWPVPKKQQLKAEVSCDLAAAPVIRLPENASERTRLTARMLAGRLQGYTGREFTLSGPGPGGIALSLSPGGPPEGYRLTVTAQGVSISGSDEPGLYYGGVTLLQLLLSGFQPRNTILPGCELEDYPDLPVRTVCLLHPWTFHNRQFKDVRSIDYLIDWVRKYVADNKQNVLVCDLSSLIQYKSQPEMNGPQAIYSLEDLSRLAQWCRDHFIELAPRWQLGSHSDWWLTIAHPELREKGDRTQADVTHPDHDRIVFNCLQEVIQATGAKYIGVGGDEWWHAPKKDEQPDPLLRGQTRAQAFMAFHERLAEFCRRQGVRPIMHEDMLVRWHNGHRFEVSEHLEQLPRDFIIAIWAYLDRNALFFSEKGFEVWVTPTGISNYPGTNALPLTRGFGWNIYGFYTMSFRFQPSYSAANTLAAGFAWNTAGTGRQTLPEAIANGYLPTVCQLRAINPAPAGGSAIIPIAGEATLSIANIPTAFTGQVLPAEVPIPGKFAELFFLHHISCPPGYPDPKQLAGSWRQYPYGEPTGAYQVHYADGSTLSIPLTVFENIGFADVAAENTLLLAGRALYNRQDPEDSSKQIRYYQFAWNNPFPDREISKISFVPESTREFRVQLYAISGRR